MSEQVTVDLPENLTIASADTLHANLEPYISGSQDVLLNAAEVTRVDTAGLQLMYVFIETLKKSSANVSWGAPSNALLDAANQLGITEQLGLKTH